jgi:HK97 family phage portal protein
MDLLHGFLSGEGLHASTPGPTDDFWYGPVGTQTAAGIKVTEEGAQKLSAWFRGRELLATALAMLPCHVYEQLGNDRGAEIARQHPLEDVVHDSWTEGWDSFTARRERMYDLIDHGWGYAWIREGRRGFADRLMPLDATLVTPEQQTGGATEGRWLFHVRDQKTGRTTTHTQDEIFYLRGAEGKGILARARESLGTAIATEQYAGKVYGSGTLSGGTIEVPGPMEGSAMRDLAQSFKTAVGDWHMPRVVPNGAKFIESKLTPEDAQMLLSRQYSVDDVARWLGVPRMMLENSDPSFGNAEQFNQIFVTYSLGPWLSLWEFAFNHQLILNTDKYYVEFTRDALVRGDIAARWQAYQIAVSTGTWTRNEVRGKENMKSLPGLDTPLDPAFLSGNRGGADKQPKRAQPQRQPRPQKPANKKAQAIVQASAARVLRKEIAEVQKLAVRHASDTDAFAGAVSDFYFRHASLVSQTLQLTDDEASAYCTRQAAQIVAGDWVSAIETWATEHYAAGLAGLALEESAA